MIECIIREKQINQEIISNRKETFRQFNDFYKEHVDDINEIVFVGSGSSNTSSTAAYQIVERFSGISTIAYLPNLFLNKTVYNPKALYVFISQTGNSTLTQQAVIKVRELGCHTVAVSEKADTKIARETELFINMGCGFEEYGMRTIGYCATILTELLMGLEMGLINGHIDQETYDRQIAEAWATTENHDRVVELANSWFDMVKDEIASGESFMIYGPKSLFGVALEAALKILEVDKRYAAVGYEMDDGLHGPNMGMTSKNRVIILNDGVSDQALAEGIAKYVKTEVGPAYIIGKSTMDEKDLPLDFVSTEFIALEFAPIIQILSYRLAVDFGVEVPLFKDMILPDQKYFNTHSEHLGKE